MVGHRFEIGERVTHPEKRFPNGVRLTELVVVRRLSGAGEPQYQLSGPDGLSHWVLRESQLIPSSPEHGEIGDTNSPTRPIAVSPWAA
jgi:hypothetical protein